MEATVRANGAVPATIGIDDGRVLVGMSSNHIEKFGKLGKVKLCFLLNYLYLRKENVFVFNIRICGHCLHRAFVKCLGVTSPTR